MPIWYDLDAALEATGMTRYGVAVAAKLEPSTLYKLEKQAAKQVETDTLERIANVLGCEPLSLLKSGPKFPKPKRPAAKKARGRKN